jgi:hypothetical protein
MKNKGKLFLVLGGLLALSWAFASCTQPSSDEPSSYTAASIAGTWTGSLTTNGVTATVSLTFDGTTGFTETVSMSGITLPSVSGTYTVSGTTVSMTSGSSVASGSITGSTTMEIDGTSFTKQ